MILYHGTDSDSASDIKENGIDLTRGKVRADFGKGFYLTPDKTNAIIWARRKSIYTTPYIVSVDFDLDAARRNGWVKEFQGCSIEWAQFVINNRNREAYIEKMALNDNNLDGRYPVVIGQIADGNIGEVSARLREQLSPVTETELKAITEAIYPLQISLHTEYVLPLIKSYRFTEIR